MADHALSAFTASDCAIIRILDERDICTDYAGEEMPRVLMASAPEVASWARVDDSVTSGQPVSGSTRFTGLGRPMGLPRQQAALFATAIPVAKSEGANEREDGATVIGSYRNRGNAENALVRLASLQPQIVSATAGDRTVYRLISKMSVLQARTEGVDDAWTLRLDGTASANF